MGISRSLPISHLNPMTTYDTPIPAPLIKARFVHRPNRFLVQVRLDVTGEVVDAHLADPGRLTELLKSDREIWVRPAENPDRKTRWSAVLVQGPDGAGLVSVDTTLPNRLVKSALEERGLEEFADWNLVRPEFTIGKSRLDFLLEDSDGSKMALEVKSVTLVEDGVGLFPDAVTARGARHVRELADLAARPGWMAAVLFVVQRPDANQIRAAEKIDPDFAKALVRAKRAGVRVLGRRCQVYRDRVELGSSVTVKVG